MDLLSFLPFRRDAEQVGSDRLDGRGVRVGEVGVAEPGEAGADCEVSGRGQWFSLGSSMWTMADAEEGWRRRGVAGGEAGWCTEMAERRQLSHCCLWKMSLTCSV